MADKIAKPELSDALDESMTLEEAVTACLRDGADVTARRFTGGELTSQSGAVLEFGCCVFERCTFGELGVKRVSFVDCVFVKCELSNCRLADATFQRVRFEGCRMTGLEILNAAVMNATFENCMLDYLSVADSKLDRVLWSGCSMRESLWTSVRLGRTAFDRCNLTQAQWAYTGLKDIDMTTCEIGAWVVNPADLRGLRVTALQAVRLAAIMGIVIQE